MQHQGLVALAALLSVAFVAPGADAEPLTRQRAQTAPIDAIAKEALAAVAPRFVEVSRPTYSGMIASGKDLQGLRMATAPRGAGSPGLCEADVIWVNLGKNQAPIASSTAYKVVDKLAPLPDIWNDAYEARLERTCAAAGPVIPPEDGDMNRTTFFRVQGETPHAGAWMAARALELAIERAQRGQLDVICTREAATRVRPGSAESFDGRMEAEGRQGCAAPVAVLAGLDLSRLAAMDIVQCHSPTENLCLSAEFLREATTSERAIWIVNLRARHREIGQPEIEAITSAELADQVWIYD